jgi:hypothetical protein
MQSKFWMTVRHTKSLTAKNKAVQLFNAWTYVISIRRSNFFFVCFFCEFYPFFSSQFSWYPIVVVATILSHRYNSRIGSGETKVESLLNTARIQPGSQPHQCVGGYTVHLATLVSVHCALPVTGVAGARWDKDIPTDQALPNPDDARPIVRQSLGVNPGTLMAQLALQYSALNHCATREAQEIKH